LSIIIALFFLIPFVASSQEWSEPSTIFSGSINRDADAVVDSNGHLHVVWAHMVSDNYWKILYSKSVDKGQTWTEPFDVVRNTSLWMSSPRIALGKNNMLYVTYDYNTANSANMFVHMKTFNGTSWSPSKVVSEGKPASYYSRLAVDTSGILYVFWYNSITDVGTFLYRTFHNDEFGNIVKPYGGSIRHFLQVAKFDKNNRLHCQGLIKFSNLYYSKLAYFSMNNGVWSDYTIISDSARTHSDMDIDSLNNPHMVWWKVTSSAAPPANGTFYSYFNNMVWSTPECLAEDSEWQILNIDKNDKIHLIDIEEKDNGFSQVHYTKSNGQWTGDTIFENPTRFGNNILISDDSLMYLFYGVSNTGINNNSLLVKSYPVSSISSISQNSQENNLSIELYPNPSFDKVTIKYVTNMLGNRILSIYNLNGNIAYNTFLEDDYNGLSEFIWNGCTMKGERLPSGIYLVQIVVGTSVTTRSVILMSNY